MFIMQDRIKLIKDNTIILTNIGVSPKEMHDRIHAPTMESCKLINMIVDVLQSDNITKCMTVDYTAPRPTVCFILSFGSEVKQLSEGDEIHINDSFKAIGWREVNISQEEDTQGGMTTSVSMYYDSIDS